MDEAYNLQSIWNQTVLIWSLLLYKFIFRSNYLKYLSFSIVGHSQIQFLTSRIRLSFKDKWHILYSSNEYNTTFYLEEWELWIRALYCIKKCRHCFYLYAALFVSYCWWKGVPKYFYLKQSKLLFIVTPATPSFFFKWK